MIESFDVKIIFEDKNLLVIDKPNGLVVHPDGRTEEESLTSWLKNFWENKFKENLFPNLFLKFFLKQKENIGQPHTLDSGRYQSRWGIVNRLDRETCGLILIAKNQKTFLNLQKQFLNKTIKKEYLAKVWGNLNEEKIQRLLENHKIFKSEKDNLYKVTQSISRHKKDPRVWTCGFTSEEGGRQTSLNAETFFQIKSFSENKNQTEVKLFPVTGRTHQLRLHMRFLGHPIVGDEKYGLNGIVNEHSTRQIEELIKMGFIENNNSRLMLHAKSLEFINPTNGKSITVESKFQI